MGGDRNTKFVLQNVPFKRTSNSVATVMLGSSSPSSSCFRFMSAACVQKLVLNPLDLELQIIVTQSCECWELNPGSL